ncbi:site-specific integrase [Leclercia adecarboxylata]|uniref:site-specific integrase n=1 Tax=Leclercia adecarboxylata TaxID=83655 RepID=UPI000E3D4BEF|nr:site-specific integrase [Leclercia adecarboxylata]RFS77880.1 site-specific integrase [Leclercia adecarboxylata]
MAIVKQVIGNTVAEWDDAVPFTWKMSETIGSKNDQRTQTVSFDLSELRTGYEDDFLLTLKDIMIERRNRMALKSIKKESDQIRILLRDVQIKLTDTTRVAHIDHVFLLALRKIIQDIPIDYPRSLRQLYSENRESTLFVPELVTEDFPVRKPVKGIYGEKIATIIATALTRAAQVEILRRAEDAFERGTIDIGHFTFLHLAFHVYCRPSSYRRLTLADLQIDVNLETQVKTYFLWLAPQKTHVSARSLKKMSYQLDSIVGELLEAQRIQVIKTWGHLVAYDDVGKIALFPARGVGSDGRWASSYAQANFGETDNYNFYQNYLYPILALHESFNFNFNGLRHTVGTQLAVAGCSATTIAAVLKHVSPYSCQYYVDIAFQGMIDTLSEAMEPAFDTHFPAFRSKNDPMAPERAISSIELSTGRRELTGECGKTNACQYAPLACYSCIRFTPCFDADHSINLRFVESEIIKYEEAGLPFRELTNQFKAAKRYIMLVVAASNQYKNTHAQQEPGHE